MVFNADGAEEAGFADLGQGGFANPIGEVFGFGFIGAKDRVIKTRFVDGMGVSFVFYGGEVYLHKPVWRPKPAHHNDDVTETVFGNTKTIVKKIAHAMRWHLGCK